MFRQILQPRKTQNVSNSCNTSRLSLMLPQLLNRVPNPTHIKSKAFPERDPLVQVLPMDLPGVSLSVRLARKIIQIAQKSKISSKL